jgi:hypothetical protein
MIKNTLNTIPKGLRDPLLKEYAEILNNFLENRWNPSVLAGGRFCEIIYTILHGYSSRNYAPKPMKPKNFVDACKRLESNSNVPRSFQILIPRILPALYEIRNNRGVGHVGGDVDPNYMDSSIVVSMTSWIMAEIVRVLHNTTTQEAQTIVNNLVERRIPLVWKSENIRRILDPNLPLKDQAIILIASSSKKVNINELCNWLDQKNTKYINKILRTYHAKRFIEYNTKSQEVEILPPGSDYVTNILKKYNL